MFVVVVIAALLVAQGEGEGEADPCIPACDVDVLHFCDFDGAVALNCADVDLSVEGESCALLSTAWGFDCLLPDGAACDADYGFGVSRCAGGACIDQRCAAGTGVVEGPPTPTPGTSFVAPVAASSDSCSGCAQAALLPPVPLLWLLRRSRRRGHCK